MANYNEMYLKSKDKIVGLRLAMVLRAEEFSIKASAEYYKKTPKTLRKWFNRYDRRLNSLEEHNKRPHDIKN